MRKNNHTIKMFAFSTAIWLACGSPAYAIAPGDVRWGNEASDTTEVTAMLIKLADMKLQSSSENVYAAARLLEGTPYAAGTIDAQPERLTVRLDSLDCTTMVETAMALAMTVEEGRTSWRDFIYNLERLRYRDGRADGYASRLHYVSDWAIDNSHRGVLREVTDRVGQTSSKIKTLDYMSSHRGSYPALADDGEFERLKNAEIGYRSHRFVFIKPSDVDRAQLRNGDVIAIVTKTPGLDVQHMGVVVIGDDRKPHMIHASSKAGKVVMEPATIADYLRRNHTAMGIRVFRLAD